jgi:tRNA(Ile2) C34 agmatinyltransferase TiaS
MDNVVILMPRCPGCQQREEQVVDLRCPRCKRYLLTREHKETMDQIYPHVKGEPMVMFDILGPRSVLEPHLWLDEEA